METVELVVVVLGVFVGATVATVTALAGLAKRLRPWLSKLFAEVAGERETKTQRDLARFVGEDYLAESDEDGAASSGARLRPKTGSLQAAVGDAVRAEIRPMRAQLDAVQVSQADLQGRIESVAERAEENADRLRVLVRDANAMHKRMSEQSARLSAVSSGGEG